MSDGLFAVFVYASALVFRSFLQDPSRSQAVRLGSVLAVTMLFRPVGIPFALLTFGFGALVFAACDYERKRSVFKTLAISVAVTGLLVLPRLAWNASQGEGWTIASQGKVFQIAVAGVVENYGKGMNFYDSELQWLKDHPNLADRPREAKETLLSNAKTWFLLSTKGAARTLFGHANIEIGSMATGRKIIGPGWFSEGDQPSSWSGIDKSLWIAGLLFAIGFASIEYVSFLRRIPREGWVNRRWIIWALLGATGFVIAPQVYGDCRFRLPVLALLFAAAIVKNRSDGPRVLTNSVQNRT
jgi:hypothetical protein